MDLSLLLPGPLATLLLAQAGADVVRVEPPGGDPMRAVGPFRDGVSVLHEWLATGKRSITADLNDASDRARVQELVRTADVLVEGFRPGALQRFGLSYDAVARDNPRLIYCSISGHGQAGADARLAGHDLTYMAQAGLLDAVRDRNGDPPLPPALVADIGAGALPAALNIVLALHARNQNGAGVHLDISMTHNLGIFNLFALADASVGGTVGEPGSRFYTGATPRYAVYRCADGRHVAVAALEDRFWSNFLQAVGVQGRDDLAGVRIDVAAAIAARPAAEWERVFAHVDVCAAVVRTSAETDVLSELPLPLHPDWAGIVQPEETSR